MSLARQRPLSVGPIRAFEAVARLLSFRAAADELFLTQSAISRQIQSLEEEVGAPLFNRGTRRVALTADGVALLAAVGPALERLDAGVRQLRHTRGRRRINVSTFASFASLWLLPRIEAYQREHAQLDIRIDTSDRMVELDEPEVEIVIRYSDRSRVSDDAIRLFDESVTPACSPRLLEQALAGTAAPLAAPADLARHTLLEEDDTRPSARFLSWRHWLGEQGLATLEPQRWVYLNYTYQQVQAALAGHGVVLARLPLVAESIARGELVELFGGQRRTVSPAVYWLMVAPAAAERPEVQRFAEWIRLQAGQTCEAIAET